MILWDVNIWVYAFRSDGPMHGIAREIVAASLAAGEPFLFYPFVASSFVRIVTNQKIFKVPSETGDAWRFLDYIETSNGTRHASLDRQAYALFKHLCLTRNAAGNAVPDVMLAAAAMRFDAELVTADKGLSNYPGLRIRLIS